MQGLLAFERWFEVHATDGGEHLLYTEHLMLLKAFNAPRRQRAHSLHFHLKVMVSWGKYVELFRIVDPIIQHDQDMHPAYFAHFEQRPRLSWSELQDTLAVGCGVVAATSLSDDVGQGSTVRVCRKEWILVGLDAKDWFWGVGMS